MAELDFIAFKSFLCFLEHENINRVKSLVTSENAKARDRSERGILWYLCNDMSLDDPGLLYHFFELGATLELDSAGKRGNPLHRAIAEDKPRMARALLDLGTPVDILNQYGYTPLYWSLQNNHMECTRMLLDAGAQLNLLKFCAVIPDWVYEFISKREQTRESSVVILGLLRCKSKVTGKNGKDVLKILARCTWSLRGL